MPEKMRPLSEEGEAKIINTLVEEVRTNFGVRVIRNLDLAREGGRVQPEYKYVIIGASNADRVGDIMKELGEDVLKITKGGVETVQERGGGDAGTDGREGPGRKDRHPLRHGQWGLLC
jgi:hypothetical protein